MPLLTILLRHRRTRSLTLFASLAAAGCGASAQDDAAPDAGAQHPATTEGGAEPGPGSGTSSGVAPRDAGAGPEDAGQTMRDGSAGGDGAPDAGGRAGCFEAADTPPSCATGDDGCEDNDAPAQAYPVEPGRDVHAVLCSPADPNASEELDYYAVELSRGCDVVVSLDVDQAAGQLDLEVTPPAGEPLAGATVEAGRQVRFAVGPSGTHLIAVRPFRRASNAYTLRVEQSCVSCDDDDVYEQNDSPDSPYPRQGQDDFALQGLACDADYYALPHPGPSAAEVRLQHDADKAPLELELLDPAGEPVAAQVVTTAAGELRLAAFLGQDGDYVLGVRGRNQAAYDLSVAFDRYACVEDGFAPNHRADRTAPLIEGDGPLRGHACRDAPDHFRFTAEAGCLLDSWLGLDTAARTVELELLDADGEELASTTPGALHYKVPRAGTYFLRVKGHSAGTTPYTVELRQSCPEATSPIAPPATLHGHLPELGQRYDRVAVGAGCELRARASHDAGARVHLYLVDPRTGRVAAGSSSGEAGSELLHVSDAGATYVLLTHLFAGTESAYEVRLTETCPAPERPELTSDASFREGFEGASAQTLEGWVFEGTPRIDASGGADGSEASLELSRAPGFTSAERTLEGKPARVSAWVKGVWGVVLLGRRPGGHGQGRELIARVDADGARTSHGFVRAEPPVAPGRDAWSHVEFRNLDWTGQRCDIYLNGERVVRGLPFAEAADALSRIRFLHLSDGLLWIDEIVMD